MRSLTLAATLLAAAPAISEQIDIRSIVETHVIPRYQILASEAEELSETAAANCSSENPDLITTYHDAFDAWVAVSHLRFGPSETDDRAFALAFWPDPRGSTPKALSALINNRDAAISKPTTFGSVSVAARGFYALEFLLFDPQFKVDEDADYICALIKAVTMDISRNSEAILLEWETSYRGLITNPSNDTFRTPTEAVQQFFTAISTGLEFTSQTRLGRPMGTFDRPRPNRAEARRSERSLLHVILALEATKELAALISNTNEDLTRAFDAALQRARDLDDPAFAGVASPQGRLRVEVLQQSIDAIRSILAEEIGPTLGIAAGFNSLDGD